MYFNSMKLGDLIAVKYLNCLANLIGQKTSMKAISFNYFIIDSEKFNQG